MSSAVISREERGVMVNPTEITKTTLFFKNMTRFITGTTKTIPIDRSTPFNPEFFGAGVTIWKGPAWGDGLVGREDQDSRSLALTELDTRWLRLETTLNQQTEFFIYGKVKETRLEAMADYIRPDARIFQTFWRKQHLIPESFKQRVNDSPIYICFDGTKLRGPSRHRYVPCLYWAGKAWCSGLADLSCAFRVNNPSVVYRVGYLD